MPARNSLSCRKGAAVAVLDGTAFLYGGVTKQLTNLILDGSPGLYVVRERSIEPASMHPSSEVPPPRQRASLVTDQVKKVLVMFGGSGTDIDFQQEVFFNDVWTTDGSRWNQVVIPLDERPHPRRAHSAVAHRRLMILFGGRDGIEATVLSDTWTLDLDSFKWNRLHVEFSGVPRKGHSAVMAGSQMLVFGGRSEADDGPYDNDLHVLDASDDDSARWTWHKRLPAPGSPLPSSRNHHTAALASSNVMVVMGGRTCHICEPLNDVWLYLIDANVWSRPEMGTSPLPRFEAVAWTSTDAFGNSVMLASGETGVDGRMLNDVWRISVTSANKATWNQVLPLDCPPLAISAFDNVIAYFLGFFISFGILAVVWQWFSQRWDRRDYAPL